MKNALLIAAVLVSGFAHASAAVDYTCAGYVPSATPKNGVSQQSISFSMTGANDAITMQILALSLDSVDPKNAFLTADSTCKFSMLPDAKYPAYRVSVQGKCGTSVNWNFKGMCFYDN